MPITVWEKPGCVQCAGVRRALDAQGVAYDRRDLSDPANADKLRGFADAGWRQAPIVETPEETFSGFDPDKVNAAAAHARTVNAAADMSGPAVTGPDIT